MKRMAAIKFSHHYLKLPEGISKARLLQVACLCDIELSPAFIEYDTVWFHDDEREHWQLPKGRLLLLLFQDVGSGMVFTTLRGWMPSKERWYRSQMGEVFDVVIGEEDGERG